MHRLLTPLAFLLLTACAQQFDPPIVDTKGHELAYQHDQADCINQAKAKANGVFDPGAPVTDCMRAKGYTILVPKS